LTLEALRGRLALRHAEIQGLNVVVLAGGGSSEREVSLASGEAIVRELMQHGYAAQLLQIGADDISLDQVLTGPATGELEAGAARQLATVGSEAGLALLASIRHVGVVFTTMHGSRGENGVWQGLLELCGVPYVSAGVKGSAVAMDKLLAKRIFERLGVPTPRYWVARPGLTVRSAVPSGIAELVVKPVDQGSSVGIEMVGNNDAGWARIAGVVQRFGRALVEERIHGRELTVGVIGHSEEPVPLPLVEISPKRGFYDYTAKYTSGQSEYICPAELSPEITALIQQYAVTVYRELDLGPYARIDCLLDAHEQPWLLEANTLPGFTGLSLLPRAAKAAGLGFGELLEILVLCAIERHEAARRSRDA
jgi:D-alanine-D-alanine ligase